MTINIYNRRHYAKREHPHSRTIYCGRRMRDIPGSPLCNPYKITAVVSRETSIALYAKLFRDVVDNAKNMMVYGVNRHVFMQALADICEAYQADEEVDLLCWCINKTGAELDAENVPVRCHCEIIRDYVVRCSTIGETDD